jgi:hypothetical protein
LQEAANSLCRISEHGRCRIKKQETPPIFWFIKDPNQTGYDDKNNAFVFDEGAALSPFAKSIGFKILMKLLLRRKNDQHPEYTVIYRLF